MVTPLQPIWPYTVISFGGTRKLMNSNIEFNKFGSETRFGTVSTCIAVAILSALMSTWWLAALAVSAGIFLAFTEWRLVFYPENQTVEVVRILCTFGEREVFDLSRLSHIEVGFVDNHTEDSTIRNFTANLVFVGGICQPFKFLSEPKIDEVVSEVQALVKRFPMPVRHSNELAKTLSAYDALTDLAS